MTTVGTLISRVRNQVKGVRQDSFLTDRYLYSLIKKHGQLLMRRADSENKLMGFASVMRVLDNVPLIEVDKIEAGYVGLKTGITIRRTEKKVSFFLQGYWGPLIRTISSVDGSEELQPTNPSNYLNITRVPNFKYNKTKYYWFLNDYIYFPNINWDAVKIEGIPEGDVSEFTCKKEEECLTRQEFPINIPDFLHAELEARVLQDLGISIQLPSDQNHDNQNLLR